MKRFTYLWKQFLLWIGAAALILMTAACAKPAAAAEPTMQLDMVQMVETAVSGTQAAADAAPAANIDAPETYQCELANEQGTLTISVDAKVIVPETGALPVAKVRQTHYTEADVRHVADVLLGRDAKYVSNNNGAESRLVPTKAFLSRELWYFQHCIETGTYDKMKYDSVEDLYPIVVDYKRQIETAPEEFAAITPSFSIQLPDGGGADNTSVYLRAARDNATVSDLQIMNDEKLSRITYRRDLIGDLWQLTHVGAYLSAAPKDASKLLAVSEADAQALAEQTVADLGLKHLTLSGKRQYVYDSTFDLKQHGVYEFMFTPAINGVVQTFTNEEQAFRADAEKQTICSWDYEQLRMMVDDDGIAWLQYNHPCAVTEIITERAALLPFAEIRHVLEKLASVSGGDYGDSIPASDAVGRLDVSEVRLGLMELPDQTSPGTALVVPVWDFFGTVTIEGDRQRGGDGYTALFTINAIDGTLISRARGH